LAWVQIHDDKPKRRLYEVLQDQGFQMNQDITFLTDGGDSLRRMVSNMSPCSEYHLDWFHIAMRFTVLGQLPQVWLIMSRRKPLHWKTASIGLSGGFGTATAARL
jgi:hypothetical protein